jgi:type III pantothenate kinase
MPEYLTPDRAASVIAARYLFKGKGCTIFDFGATLTIDKTDSEGNYSGGNISLGCRTRFKSLHRYSRNLPLIDLDDEVPCLGNSLEKSLLSGVVSGMLFEINGYLSDNSGNITVFTGGDANYFAKRMKNCIFAVCNLVLMGLALIAFEYDKKD